MGNQFDHRGKKIGRWAVGPSGLTIAPDEISSRTHHADPRHEPTGPVDPSGLLLAGLAVETEPSFAGSPVASVVGT